LRLFVRLGARFVPRINSDKVPKLPQNGPSAIDRTFATTGIFLAFR
jgi:hypothetical protein